MKNADDPQPWIYAIFATGFLSGNFVVLLWLVLDHGLPELADWGWALYLGGFLGFGLLGMAAGSVGGLFIKLVCERVTGEARAGGWPAVVTSGLLSATVCGPLLYWVVALIMGL